MNNQAKNVTAPSLFGLSGTTLQAHQQHSKLMNQQRSHTSNNLLSQLHPQTNFHGHFQLSESQSQVLARARAQFQAAQAHLQSQTQPVIHLHNANANVPNVTSTPATGSGKRASQKTPSRLSGSSNTNQSLPSKTLELTPASRRRKRELPEMQAPENVAAILPESALYTQLLDLEAQMDDLLYRRKINAQEALKCDPRLQKTLRVYVFNTFSNHTKMDSEKKNAEESSWSLKITGRILEDGKDPVSGDLQRSSPSCPQFSAFFKKITICLDQSLYPDSHVIVWNSAFSPNQQDGFEVKRKGDKEFTAGIRLEMNYSPQKFKVSTQLSKLLGIEVETRPRIMAALWNYVKCRKLQSPDDPSFFICDPSLQMLFGEEKMEFTMAAQKLLQHLSEPQPIHLEHNIKLSGCCPAGTSCYDIQVDVPFPLEKEMSEFLATNESQKEIEASDEVIRTSLKKIQEHHRRRAFFLSFSQAPEEFINSLIASQSKDLKLVARHTNRTGEKDLHSEFYNQPWVEDAVIRYLNRKTAGSDAHGGN